MQDNLKTYALIDGFLNGTLSDKEKFSFEKELKSNVELKELVNEYKLANQAIIQNELFSINSKLSAIHSIAKRKKLVRGLLGIILVSIIAIATIIAIKNKKPDEIITNEKSELTPENTKIMEIVSEPTPFKIIDSMTEVELSVSLEESKSKVIIENEIDSVPVNINSITAEVPKSTPEANSFDSTFSSETDAPSLTIKNENQDSVKTLPCELELTSNFIELTSSCKERNTGAILILKADKKYSYSIDNKLSYTENPYFNNLEGGNYSVSIKENNCESDNVEVIIETYQCNYVIHPDRFVYFEKSLEKFQSESIVEILIFNKTGNLVFNKTVSTYEKFIWDGNSNTNFPTPMGVYFYMLKSGSKISQGEITIIR